ncbi:MAG TPA: glycosyltransferase 87 family protein [Vicinamibacteria bacterium]|nr:glycosyltransferase 87 family protein [Vicinamibacteria bacterium]
MKARPPLDGLVVPPLLLLIARELALFDPTRELAWPLFHELKDTPRPVWLAPLLPRPAPVLYDDPVALLLAFVATLLAAVYGTAALLGARARVRAGLLALAASLLVALPTVAVIGLGLASGRPYGHDGGVVQLPLALERTLAGQSPYGADYSRSILGEQSRASVFWQPLGGNPIVKHHWYLPGMHLVMAPALVVSRAVLGFFDPRLVTLLGFALAALLAARLVPETERRLAAAALVLLHPLVFWPQVFGTNDVLSAVPLLLAALLARAGRPVPAAVLLGLAASVKQLTWPFAPFILVYAADVGSFREAVSREGARRLVRLAAVATSVFLAVVLPLALRDWGAFVDDILRYQTGARGGDQYPLGGTPGFGLANLLIYTGGVTSLSDDYPFSRFALLFAPAGLLLLRFQFRARGLAAALVAGSAALLLSLYFSRLPNPNYVTLAALFLPIALLMRPSLGLDTVLAPLALLALALEAATHQLLATTWAAGAGAGLPSALLPDPGGPRWRDPLSTGWSGLLAGLGIAYLFGALLGLGRRGRAVMLGASAVAALVLPLGAIVRTGEAEGLRRGQDRFLAEATEAAEAPGPGPWGQRPGVVRTPVLEAWPASWRRDPPRELPRNLTSHGAFALGRLTRALGIGDPRWPLAVAMVLAAGVAAFVLAPDRRPALVATLCLGPPVVLAVLFGSGAALAVAAVTCAALVGHRRVLVAPLAGLAASPWPIAGVAVLPFSGIVLLVVGSAIWAAPLLWGYPGELLRLLKTDPPLQPSLGLTNLLFYWPDLPAELDPWLRGIAVAALLTLAWVLHATDRMSEAPAACAASLATTALLVGPPATGHAVALPVTLFLLAAVLPDRSGSPTGG